MSKFAYYSSQDGRVLQWIDTEAMAYNLPDASMLHSCSDDEWELRFQGEMMVKNGAVVPYIAPDPDLAQLKAAKWDDIKSKRDRRSEAGCQVSGNWFHNDLKSRTQWERMANRAKDLADADPYLVDGVQVVWKTMGGEFVPLTAGLIRQVVDAFEIQEVATFRAAEIHRAAMEASGDPSAYDYSGGWPETYQEQ